jgi:hypothetical protein
MGALVQDDRTNNVQGCRKVGEAMAQKHLRNEQMADGCVRDGEYIGFLEAKVVRELSRRSLQHTRL